MDYQQKQISEICDKLREMSIEEKSHKFKQLANSSNETDLGAIIKAITTHIKGRDGFNMPDLIISSGQVRFDIPMVNEDLNVKYESNYFNSQNWIYEACLDIYLGLHEFGFMNYKNSAIYNLLTRISK